MLLQLTLGDQPLPDTGPVHFQLGVPKEFQRLVHTFTAEQIHTMYPEAHNYRREGHFGYDQSKTEYMGPALFLRSYPVYKFAWVMEHDCRYIGDSWGSLLSQMLHIAVRTIVSADAKTAFFKPKAPRQPLPDFIFLDDVIRGPLPNNWYDSGVRKNPKFKWETPFKEMTGLYGMSQNAVHRIHEVSLRGESGFIEEFLPTLAVNLELDVVLVPTGSWNGRPSLDNGWDVNPTMYDNWYWSGECHPYALLHPVKRENSMKGLDDSAWLHE